MRWYAVIFTLSMLHVFLVRDAKGTHLILKATRIWAAIYVIKEVIIKETLIFMSGT